MAKIIVNKNKDYTVMSNYHLREKDMSLKAKGLLSLMLSLPDDWDYSVKGLVAICKENETAINSTLAELKEFGYLEIVKLMPNQTKTGRIEYIYNVYEMPKQEGKKQDLEILPLEIQPLENQVQLNTNNKILKNKILKNNKKENKISIDIFKEKAKYGKYQRVELTEEEYLKLCKEHKKFYIDRVIPKIDEYIESTNNKNKYTNFYLLIERAIKEKWKILDDIPTYEYVEEIL